MEELHDEWNLLLISLALCPMHVRMSVAYLATSKSCWKYCNRWNHKESFEPEKHIIGPFLHRSLLSHLFQKMRGGNNHRKAQLHDPHCAESRSGQISFCHGEWLLIHIALSRNYVNSFSTGFDIASQSVLVLKNLCSWISAISSKPGYKEWFLSTIILIQPKHAMTLSWKGYRSCVAMNTKQWSLCVGCQLVN